jgi:hypothetical protein
MSLSAPTPPDPAATAAAQQKLNQQSAITTAETNMVNQQTPYGSLNYTQTGTNADGTPIFSAATTLSPAEQGLFNTTVGTQQGAATTAGNLIKNLGPELSNAPNLGNDSLVNTMMGWQQKYMQPIFDQQQSNLDSKLAAQGITAGSTAYDNAQNLQSRNVNNAYEGAMAQDEGQAFNQAAEAYQLPVQTLGTLLGEGQPASPTTGMANTPQETIQPANLEGLVQQNYQSSLGNYANTMGGIFGLGSALLGAPGVASGIGGILGGGLPNLAGLSGGSLSDRRAKMDIARVGKLNDGTPVYRFRYRNGDPEMRLGLMAQDIADDMPDAVMTGDDGFMRVDYERATERSMEAMIDG